MLRLTALSPQNLSRHSRANDCIEFSATLEKNELLILSLMERQYSLFRCERLDFDASSTSEPCVGHEPLSLQTKRLFKTYADDVLAAERYDFFMSPKLRGYLETCGFTVSKMLTVEDQEVSFSGPAMPDVLEAWRARFGRMQLLRNF